MSAFKVKRWFALHSGGTKFYQVFLIESDVSKTAYVVTHWGSFQPGHEHLPLHFGQTKIKVVAKGEGNWEAQRAITAKASRGYKFETPTADEFYSQSPFQDHLEKTFKRATALDIFMAVAMDEPAVTKEEADLDHLFGIESKPKAPEPVIESPKHDEWGTW